MTPFIKVSIETPVSCPTLFMTSRNPLASSALSPKAVIVFCTVSIAPFKSVPLIVANCMNLVDRLSSSSPVNPNRVLTSPIAVPASSKDVGIDVATFFTFCSNSFIASPEAPVFVTTMSSPLSTSLKDATAPAPSAMIGAVTPFVMLSPIPDIFSPVALTSSPATFSCC